jgi:hypothetical protein
MPKRTITARKTGEVEAHERQSEFKARYHFVCRQPQRLSQIEVRLFRVFAGIAHVEVNLVGETTQTALEMTANTNKIKL